VSLFDGISTLEALDVCAAGFLVQALGERVPGGLICALKVQGLTRPLAAAGVPVMPTDGADPVPEQIDTADAAPTINQSPPQQLAEVTPAKRPIVPELSREESS
jgi:hypothetical protein